MEAYRHYSDYLIKKAMTELGSVDNFLRYVFYDDSLWYRKVLGLDKNIKGFEGIGQREDLNKVIKQETLDGGLIFDNARVIIEGESSIEVEDIYQLLRQEAAVLMPGEKRKVLIAVIISMADSYIHKIDQRSYPFLEITNILGPKTFIGFASINLYLIESEFYERYFEGLFNCWTEAEVEQVLNRSFSSLLFSYWIRRLWLERNRVDEIRERLAALKGFLDNIWSVPSYSSLFYETLEFFKQEVPELVSYFDAGGMKMKSFVDTMPESTRKIYEEVLVAPVAKQVAKQYEEKIKQSELENKLEIERIERELERVERQLERAEQERNLERAERQRELERAERERQLERAERERQLERAERERNLERAERERNLERAQRERGEKELKTTCQQAVVNKFPEISARALLTINQLSFSKCNKLLLELGMIPDVHSCELFLKNLL